MTHARLPTDTHKQALSLVESCQTELDELIGTCRWNFSTFDLRQSDAGPALDFDGDTAILLLGPHATLYEPTLVAHVAHESVHLHLTDGEYGNASGLEEGFAVHFALSIVERNYGAQERWHHVKHLEKAYATALADYEFLLAVSSEPAKRVRDAYDRLTGVRPRELRRLFPTLGWWMSYRLARRRRMRAG